MHRLAEVTGVVLVRGGRHRLVVRLADTTPDPTAAQADIDVRTCNPSTRTRAVQEKFEGIDLW